MMDGVRINEEGVPIEHETVKETNIPGALMRSELNAECYAPPEVNEPGILGTIGGLISVASEDKGSVADKNLVRVVSWHLQDYLGIHIVLKRDAALKLHKAYPDQQFQVAELLRDVVDWNSPVEERLRGYGNPVYLRSLLQFEKLTSVEIQELQKCLNTILGDTLVVDNLESAKIIMDTVRTETILTRDGNRLNIGDEFSFEQFSTQAAPAWEELKLKLRLAESGSTLTLSK